MRDVDVAVVVVGVVVVVVSVQTACFVVIWSQVSEWCVVCDVRQQDW